MARIEQRVCDRCFLTEKAGLLHASGWNEIELNEGDFDLCSSCSVGLMSWIGSGVPQDASVHSAMLPSAAG